MEKTWRWFGRNDIISLSMLKQIGVEGIVTALHDKPNGAIWDLDSILNLKKFIEKSGLKWSVVESLPVSESIKYGGDDRDKLIENYIVSLGNIAKAGIKTVCYNFMPVIDWIRTDLMYKLPDGSFTLYFDKIKFGYFDIYILERKGAKNDYSTQEIAKIEKLSSSISEKEKASLIDTIIVKTQGFINGNISDKDLDPVSKFKALLNLYDGIDVLQLRENMKYFLEAVMPVCDKYGINMCVHPDDPPFQMLGLPRIVTCRNDIKWILDSVPNEHNGLTFCAGSLSAGTQNDVVSLAKDFVDRIKFVHLRSTEVFDNGNFREASHLDGRANLIELVRVFQNSCSDVPMRVDHGRTMLGDDSCPYNAGYSFYGRMYAMAQIQGMEAVVNDEIKKR